MTTINIPNYGKTFKSIEDQTIDSKHITTKYYWNTFNGYERLNDDWKRILKKTNDSLILHIPKGALLKIVSIDVKKRDYTYSNPNFIKIDLVHPIYKGCDYSTVPRIRVDFLNQSFEALSQLKLEEHV